MMKNVLRFTAAVAAAVFLLCGLAACGGKKDDENAGEYVGTYYKYVGDEDSDRVEGEEFSLLLNPDGTGRFRRDGTEFITVWKLDGEKFTMTETFLGIKNEYSGTLKDGELHIFNGDVTNPYTCEYVFKK